MWRFYLPPAEIASQMVEVGSLKLPAWRLIDHFAGSGPDFDLALMKLTTDVVEAEGWSPTATALRERFG